MRGLLPDIAALATVFYTLAALALWVVTRQSLKVSEQALEASQRAWVVMGAAPKCVDENWPPLYGVTVSLANSGHSPANCRAVQKCFVQPSNEKLDVLKELSTHATTSNFMVAPGQSVQITIPTPEELQTTAHTVIEGKTLLLLIGRVEYQDGFSKPRTTVYCWSYGEDKHLAVLNWRQCQENNWCD